MLTRVTICHQNAEAGAGISEEKYFEVSFDSDVSEEIYATGTILNDIPKVQKKSTPKKPKTHGDLTTLAMKENFHQIG